MKSWRWIMAMAVMGTVNAADWNAEYRAGESVPGWSYLGRDGSGKEYVLEWNGNWAFERDGFGNIAAGRLGATGEGAELRLRWVAPYDGVFQLTGAARKAAAGSEHPNNNGCIVALTTGGAPVKQALWLREIAWDDVERKDFSGIMIALREGETVDFVLGTRGPSDFDTIELQYAIAPADMESLRLHDTATAAHDDFWQSLAQVEFTKPLYRNSIYASAPDKRVRLALNYKAEILGNAPIAVKLVRQPDGQEVLPAAELHKNGDQVEFDLAQVAPGNYAFACASVDMAGNPMLRRIPLRVLPPAAGNEVWLDGDGILMVNGRKEFPVGIYHFDDYLEQINADNVANREEPITMERMAREIAERGFTSGVTVTWMKDDPFPDLAEAHNLDMIRYVDPNFASVRDAVARLRNHPALLMWKDIDEPHQEWQFESAVKGYELLRRWDPYHPVLVTQCYSDMHGAAAKLGDILAVDSYPLNVDPWWLKMPWWKPEWKSPLRILTQSLDVAVAQLPPGKPLWIVVQAIGGEKPTHLPTPLEYRNMLYQGLVAGARGVLVYAYVCADTRHQGGRYYYIARESALWDEVGKTNRELEELTPYLLAHGGEKLVNSTTGDVRVLARDYEGKRLIMAVNISDYAEELEVNVGAFHSATPKFDSGHPVLAGGVLRDTLPPFAVKVYELQ